MRKYTTFLALVLSIFVFSSVISCSEAAGLKSQILGKWLKVGVEVGVTTESSIEFLKDGTVIFVQESVPAAGDYRFVDDNRLRVDLGGGGAMVFEVSINAKTGEMLLKEPNGKAFKYLTKAEFARRVAQIKNPTPIELMALKADVLGNFYVGKELFSGQQPFSNIGPPCGSCHRAGEIGQGTSAPDLTSIYAIPKKNMLVRGVWLNSGVSPSMSIYAQKNITDEEVENLRAFLWYSWKWSTLPH